VLKTLHALEDLVLLLILLFWQLIDRRRFIILSNKYGNIGNQLYMTCFLVHWANIHNVLTFNYGLIGNEHYFKNTKHDLFLNYPLKRKFFTFSKLKNIISKSIDRISLRLNRHNKFQKLCRLKSIELTSDSRCSEITKIIHNNRILFLRNFIHDVPYSYFKDSYDSISSHLKPLSKFDKTILEPINKLSDSEILIGVVIRHGDYRHWKNGKYFLKTSIYHRWMIELEKLFSPKKVGFFIASDEQQDLSIFNNQNIFFRSGNPIPNLYSLAHCDFMITVNSSFAGWSHFIGKVPCFIIDKNVRRVQITDFKNWF
jgi:hypothetical protein